MTSSSILFLLPGILTLLGVILLILRRPAAPDLSALEPRLAELLEAHRRSELTAREEASRLRDELARRLEANQSAQLTRQDEARRDAQQQIEQLRAATEKRLEESREALAQAMTALRAELTHSDQSARAELRQLFTDFQNTIQQVLTESRATQNTQLADFSTRLETTTSSSTASAESLRQSVEARLREATEVTTTTLTRHRAESNDSATVARAEARQQFTAFQTTVDKALAESRSAQDSQLNAFSLRLTQLQSALNEQLDRSRQALDTRLAELQTQNAAKLDEMRQTVDQRLQATLEQRLGESFKLVGDNLERVIRSLGEMQQMAASVGDLKRVLTNVKTRGSWGEVQLGNLLAQTLTAEQFAANVAPRPDSRELVEFAIRLPGPEAGGPPVWLPIDAKFPTEDYDRLALAADRADQEGVAAATKALADRVRSQARTISEKYIAPPHTTDFALLFLPTEGLYAEVLRQPGLASEIQQQFRIVLAGPTTLTALLNSLQMGFRTLAIERRASEVWQVLGAVKTEFGKFGDAIEKVQKKLAAASKEIEATGTRTRAINRKLRDIESLPATDTAKILPSMEAAPDAATEEDDTPDPTDPHA